MLFLYISFSNALITQDFTPTEYRPLLSVLLARRVLVHTTCYTLRYTVNTAHAPLGKIMSAWCVIRGVLAFFSVKEKYFSRIILVGLIRTRDNGTFRNLHSNGNIFYEMYCRTTFRNPKLSYGTCLII